MNSTVRNVLKAVALGAEDTLSGMVPGSGLVIKGVTALVDKDHENNIEAIDNLENGLLTAIGSLAPSQVSNASLIAAGVADLRAGFMKIKQGLSK